MNYGLPSPTLPQSGDPNFGLPFNFDSESTNYGLPNSGFPMQDWSYDIPQPFLDPSLGQLQSYPDYANLAFDPNLGVAPFSLAPVQSNSEDLDMALNMQIEHNIDEYHRTPTFN